jgi:hypothetical protein
MDKVDWKTEFIFIKEIDSYRKMLFDSKQEITDI